MPPSLSQADWRFNPYTGKLDYFESGATADVSTLVPYTGATGSLNLGSNALVAGTITSPTNSISFGSSGIVANTGTFTVGNGIAPFFVNSSTVVTNLNADYLDGHDSLYYMTALLIDQSTPQIVTGGYPYFSAGLNGNIYDSSSTSTLQPPPLYNGTYVIATSKLDTNYWPYYAMDPAKSLTGSWTGNAWATPTATTTNQRFNIDLGSSKAITKIYYENAHNSGNNTDAGVKNFTFQGSNSSVSFNSTTYADNTGWDAITTSQNSFDIHVASNVADPKYITATNTTPYRYYSFKFADTYGSVSSNRMVFRRVGLQMGLPKLSVDTTNRALYASDESTQMLTWGTGSVSLGSNLLFTSGTGTIKTFNSTTGTFNTLTVPTINSLTNSISFGSTGSATIVAGTGTFSTITTPTITSQTNSISFGSSTIIAGTATVTLGDVGFPYLMQADATSQQITTLNTPQVLTFDTDIYHSGITRTSSSRFTVPMEGTYLITFSGIADLKGGANKHIEVWLRVNGSDVAGSNTRVEIPSALIEMTVAVSFVQTFTANQYFELWTAGDVSAGASGIEWSATAAGSTAGNVASPSLIMTANKISK